jgi:hypothetical protein
MHARSVFATDIVGAVIGIGSAMYTTAFVEARQSVQEAHAYFTCNETCVAMDYYSVRFAYMMILSQ